MLGVCLAGLKGVGGSMIRSIYALFLALILGLSPAVSASPQVDTSQVTQFKTEQAAQKHCLGDTVKIRGARPHGQ